ncbi:MAG: hypothetical protein K8R59_08745 [Thermoanaerobaculales bacterium]|nr:hypothetical protein [Thermoanaerobaculales bacterium]
MPSWSSAVPGAGPGAITCGADWAVHSPGRLFNPEFQLFLPVVDRWWWNWTSQAGRYWEGFWGAFYADWTIVNLIPEDDRPYYGYVSVVFSPEDAEVTPFSDPSYISARPGYIPLGSEYFTLAGEKE